MCIPVQWRLKRNITADVLPPIDPDIYAGDTDSLKSRHKVALKLYNEYEEHKRNKIKAIQACLDEIFLIDLELDGILVRYTPIEIYEYMWNNFLLPVKEQEILKAKELLKVEYNPDRIV